jgi:DNA-directed RNA polymerase specialized sigma54-like protein
MKKTNLTKTRSQIADEYGIHRNTLCRLLKKKDITLPQGLLYPQDVKRIYEALGYPKKVQRPEDEE